MIVQVCKYFPGVPPRFYVSDDGTVYKRLKRFSNGQYKFTYNGVKIQRKHLTPDIPVLYYKGLTLLEHNCRVRRGYKTLPVNPKTPYCQYVELHKIIARIFNNVDIENLIVHHVDGNKLNNHKDNLVALTRTESMREYPGTRRKFRSFDYEFGNDKGTWESSLKSFCTQMGIHYYNLWSHINNKPNQTEYNHNGLRIYNIYYK